MKIVDIILLPFVFMFRGFKFIIMLPFNAVKGIFGTNKKKASKETISAIKPGEEIKVVKGVRSAYDTPREPHKETDPVKINQAKQENTAKRQRDFEKLVAKARMEEEKRIKEQEKRRLEIEKKEEERLAKEAERAKKEEALDAIREKREADLRKKGVPVTLDEKLKALKQKLFAKKEDMLELEAKKEVLNEQFKDQKSNTSRFQKPLLFQYIARNSEGQIEKSTIEALSRVDVHSFLVAEGYEVYDITAAKGAGSIEIGSFKFKKSKLIFYLSQLSAYIKSGIVLADAVKILDNQAKNVNEKKCWRAVYYDLSMGDNLSAAMEKRKDAFPKLLINMIKTAEMTGNLAETLDDMVDYYTESEETKKQMKSAMTYPIIVLIFAIGVMVFIMLYVVPSFKDIFSDMGQELPKITVITLAISEFLQANILYIFLAFIGILITIIVLYRNVKSVRKSLQELAMHLPVFGNIIIYNEVTVFTKTFANLINHNVFITDSIDVLSKITSNEIYKKLIFDTANNLTKGETISKAFKNHWAFPNIAYQMLITGEKTGRLGPMMEKVSSYYQEQHRNIINQLKSLIEPILIISLAVIVGIVLMAVIIPMFKMYEGIS